jgi:SRSO17 transposase
MQITKTEYNMSLLEKWKSDTLTPAMISEKLSEFLGMFNGLWGNSTRIKNFTVYIKGLLSNIKRKSIEPIALEHMGESGVRTLQNFITRSNFEDEKILKFYQEQLAVTTNAPNGMLSVDGSDFPKKGKKSVGVKRQYCGRLGKVENCQAGVFSAYASNGGYGIVDRELYLPKDWFDDEHEALRKECQIPDGKEFKTKNEIALDMIKRIMDKNIFHIKWIGCDAAFGCDHDFIDALPNIACYFATIKKNERVFLPGCDAPQTVESLAKDDNFNWEKAGFEGSKGTIYSDVKIIRVFSCRTIKDTPTRREEIWLYIRRYSNGDTRYFLSNAPESITHDQLHEAVTLRWPIEQCFEECKTELGMADFEGRSYNGFLRHLLFVMIAHFFGTNLRLEFKKTISP